MIKKVDEIAIKNFTALTGYLSAKRPGDRVRIEIDRSGERITTPVTLTKNETADLSRLGLRVQNLNEQTKKRFGRSKGVIITAAADYYRNYELEGKLIIAIDGNSIETIEDAIKANENLSGRRALTLLDDKGTKETLIFN